MKVRTKSLGAKNVLLVRDDIGRAKPPTRDLPPTSHTFGYITKPDAIGVGGRKFNYILLITLSVHD